MLCLARHGLVGVAAALMGVAMREWLRPPGPAWQVQQCQPPLQSPLLHSQLLRAGSDKALFCMNLQQLSDVVVRRAGTHDSYGA